MFQKMEVSLVEQMMRVGAQAPGYFERVLKELEVDGKVDGSVSTDCETLSRRKKSSWQLSRTRELTRLFH